MHYKTDSGIVYFRAVRQADYLDYYAGRAVMTMSYKKDSDVREAYLMIQAKAEVMELTSR